MIDASVMAPPQDSVAEKSGLNELVDLKENWSLQPGKLHREHENLCPQKP